MVYFWLSWKRDAPVMFTFSELSTSASVALVSFGLIWLISVVTITAAFYWLVKCRQLVRQRVILFNLNFTELLFCITIPIRLIRYFTECPACDYVTRFDTWIGFWYYASFFFITFDRALCLVLGVKYNVLVTAKRLKITSVFVSLVCFLCSLPFYFLSKQESLIIVNSIIYPVLDLLFVTTAIAIYTTILVKLHKDSPSSDNRRRTFDVTAFRRRYAVPLLIVLSFVVFIQAPSLYIIMSVYLNDAASSDPEKAFIETLIIYSLWFIGFFFDSLIYIGLVNKRHRRVTQFSN